MNTLKSVRKYFVHVSTFTNILDYYVLCFLFSKILKKYFYNFLICDRISVLLSLIITYWLSWPFSWGWTDFRDVKNFKIFPRNSSITSKDIDVGSGGAFVFRAHRDRNQDHRRNVCTSRRSSKVVFCCCALQPCWQTVKMLSVYLSVCMRATWVNLVIFICETKTFSKDLLLFSFSSKTCIICF